MHYFQGKGLSKSFPAAGQKIIKSEPQVLFKDLSFELHQGEIVALLGPSGCGKTTLINIMAGFIPPDNGQILLQGKKCLGPGPDRGVVFQETTLFPWLTALENVCLAIKTKGWTKKTAQNHALNMLAKVGLGAFTNFLPSQLSGGMRQRVELARILVMHPKILLMDEPFAALDALTRELMYALLITLHRDLGLTIFLVTHDLHQALILADKILVMFPGQQKEFLTYPIPQPRILEYGQETIMLGQKIKKDLLASKNIL